MLKLLFVGVMGFMVYMLGSVLLRDEKNKRFIFFNRSMLDSFECGFMGSRYSTNAGGFFYMLIMVFFVVFDLEVALLLKLPYQDELYFNYWLYFMFLFLVSAGFGMEMSKGYVRWYE